ncbi:hypothetical protein [Microbacterium sp. 13-71-7]|jgi:hypothetical protein|uniref:hypothetical protein n=1 Tax=Microbacterium sp. 13-71-7 TaxID=1970399 RepID=UPI000BCBCDA4|nr:hypothetical protein [Microbacterium sp. 13-71-7]OZB83258.1 MAG: hypothetical protein B7X32_10970 [Microbacterium sp. 13-71-7]
MPVLPPPRVRPRLLRLIRYRRLRIRHRWARAALRHAVRMEVWIYLAAGALLGFEGLEALLGAMLIAPELVPLVLLALAVVWTAKRRGRWIVRRIELARRRRGRRRVRRPGA